MTACSVSSRRLKPAQESVWPWNRLVTVSQSAKTGATNARAKTNFFRHRCAQKTPQSRHREVLAMRKGRSRINRNLFEKVESDSLATVRQSLLGRVCIIWS